MTLNESNDAAVKSAEAALDRAKINLDYATIYAPISGVVVNRAVNVGQTVAASFSSPTLFTIANDLKKMQVQTTVDESDVGRVSVGQEAAFTVDAYADDQFQGTVSQIRLAPQSIQNVVNYIVVIDVFNDQLKLMPGMTANVKIKAASAIGTMRVPNMALRFQPPSDLVDTTVIGSMRPGFSGRGEGRGDSTQMAQNSLAPGEFGKLPGKTSTAVRQEQPASVPKTKIAASGDAAKFGIDSKYPEYQKSAYVPSHQSGRGRVWVLKSNGKLEPVFVRTGLNDGRYTEITSRRLNAGDQIVLGAVPRNDPSANVAPSPLAGQSQQRPMGGMGR
jgi:HlyD family secretion protein